MRGLKGSDLWPVAARALEELARGIGEVLGAIGAWIDEHWGERRPVPVPIPVDDDRDRDDRPRRR